MKSSTKWLIGFGSAIGVLVILAIVLVLALPGEKPLPPEDTPEGVVMRYFKALEEEDYREAYSYLSEAARTDKDWVATFDSWVGYSYYPEQRKSVWKVTVIEVDKYDLTASVDVEISSFEPKRHFRSRFIPTGRYTGSIIRRAAGKSGSRSIFPGRYGR
jgi:hypothetical protein